MLATASITVTASRVVVEMGLKVEVMVTVVVVATVVVVVAKETVDVVPADAGTTTILLTKMLGILCPGMNARPLLRHANVCKV